MSRIRDLILSFLLLFFGRYPGALIDVLKLGGFPYLGTKYLEETDFIADVRGGSITLEILRQKNFQNDLMIAFQAATNAKVQYLFVNVGANVGSTCFNAHFAGYRRFLAFEPVKKNFRLLAFNLSMLGASEIRLFNNAVGSVSGSAAISLNGESGGRHSFRGDFSGGSEQVDVCNLNSYKLSEPFVLWIDTEGFEVEVIKGGENSIMNFCAAMCVEVNTEKYSSQEAGYMIEILRSKFSKFGVFKKGAIVECSIDDALAGQGQVDLVCW